MKYKPLLLLFILPFFSCKNDLATPVGIDLYFQNTQPVNDSELTKIPNKFLGSYLIDNDFYMVVSKEQILTEYYECFRIHKKEMDSLKRENTVESNRIIDRGNNLIYDFKTIGDSIELSRKDLDTIFEFSPEQKMKRVGNCLILNKKDSVFWKATIIRFKKKSAAIEYLYDLDQLYQLDSLTKIKSKMIDSSKFILSPSRKEFKKYLEISKDSPFHKLSKM